MSRSVPVLSTDRLTGWEGGLQDNTSLEPQAVFLALLYTVGTFTASKLCCLRLFAACCACVPGSVTCNGDQGIFMVSHAMVRRSFSAELIASLGLQDRSRTTTIDCSILTALPTGREVRAPGKARIMSSNMQAHAT